MGVSSPHQQTGQPLQGESTYSVRLKLNVPNRNILTFAARLITTYLITNLT